MNQKRSTLGSAAFGSGRESAQRVVIARAVDGAAGAFTAGDLAAAVRGMQPGVGVATVYRAVSAMEKTGFIEAVGSRDHAVLYTRCRGRAHHHHAVCTSCGAVSETHCPLDLDELALDGFSVSSHSLVIYGLCAGCRS